MTDTNEIHVVFGASGPLGGAVVRELAARGKRVRAVNRSGNATVPEGVEVVSGDATKPESTRRVCQGAAVVYHCMGAPYADWPTLFPPLMDGLIEGAAAAGAKLIFGDNLYLSGPVDGPLTEDPPPHPTPSMGLLGPAGATVPAQPTRREGIRTRTSARLPPALIETTAKVPRPARRKRTPPPLMGEGREGVFCCLVLSDLCRIKL